MILAQIKGLTETIIYTILLSDHKGADSNAIKNKNNTILCTNKKKNAQKNAQKIILIKLTISDYSFSSSFILFFT